MIRVKRYKDWPQSIQRQLYSLNHRSEGAMRDALIYNPKTYVILNKDGLVLSWALVDDQDYSIHMYTRKNYRRLGLASRIRKRMRGLKSLGVYTIWWDARKGWNWTPDEQANSNRDVDSFL